MHHNPSIWRETSKFQSSTTTQAYLNRCYEKQGFSDHEKLSYQNCVAFIYYLEHGEKYYRQAAFSPIELQPILLFYGMVQLLKAAILTKDPFYPETSQVLAHGVSTRKRKKSNYLFLHDEVKVQKNGLLSHFADKLFHVKQFSMEKYKMRQLFVLIPELHDLFFFIEEKQLSYRLASKTKTKMLIKSNILDDFHLSKDGLLHFLRARSNFVQSIREGDNKNLEIILDRPLDNLKSMPFLFHSGQFYYLLRSRDDYIDIPEMVAHYLILYNLSMICRYETEWWGDLFQHYPDNDYPFIKDFLQITQVKIPFLVFEFLNQQF